MPRRTPPPPPKKKANATLLTCSGEHPWEPYVIPGIDVMLRRRIGARAPNVPDINSHYSFREDLVRELAWAMWPHDGGDPTPCLLAGPKGCGKTSLVTEIAGRCNIPVHRMNLNVGTTTRHLKGRGGAKGGSTTAVHGAVPVAMESGAWLLLDEVSGATPPVALSLFPVLEPDGAVFLEYEDPQRYAVRHPDFRVLMTDNTIGAEQESTRFQYAGTNPNTNVALLDRIGSTLQVGYLASSVEDVDGCAMEFEAIMAAVPGIEGNTKAEAMVEGMIRTAATVRSSDEISLGFSTRMVKDWARRLAAGRITADGTIIPYADDGMILALAEGAFLRKIRSRVERDAIAEVIRSLFEIRESE